MCIMCIMNELGSSADIDLSVGWRRLVNSAACGEGAGVAAFDNQY